MNAEETRKRLKMELEAQFLNDNFNMSKEKEDAQAKSSVDTVLSFAPGEPVVTFPSPTFEKPKMFMPKSITEHETSSSITSKTVKGIGFSNKIGSTKKVTKGTGEIYDMQALISTNPEGMQTLAYDEKVVKKQLALVKRKEWQDILFSDVNWFMQIDLTSGIKKLFNEIKF